MAKVAWLGLSQDLDLGRNRPSKLGPYFRYIWIYTFLVFGSSLQALDLQYLSLIGLRTGLHLLLGKYLAVRANYLKRNAHIKWPYRYQQPGLM